MVGFFIGFARSSQLAEQTQAALGAKLSMVLDKMHIFLFVSMVIFVFAYFEKQMQKESAWIAL